MRAHMRVGMLALWFVAPGAIIVPAGAQTSDGRKWDVEIHGGGSWPTNPAGGTTNLPGPGEVFTTVPGVTTLSPPPSRRESSWYFGDGASCSIRPSHLWQCFLDGSSRSIPYSLVPSVRGSPGRASA
jgi:hypothetical protein